MRPIRPLVAGLALAATLAACPSEDPPPPAPLLTRLDLGGAHALLGAAEPRLLKADAAGTFSPVTADAWGVPFRWRSGPAGGPFPEHTLVAEAWVGEVVDLGPEHAFLVLRVASPPPGLDDQTTRLLPFLLSGALLRKADRAVQLLPLAGPIWGAWEAAPALPAWARQLRAARNASLLQLDGGGLLHMLDAGERVAPIWPDAAGHDAFPRSAVGDAVASFVFDDAGRLVYRAERGFGFPGSGTQVLAVSPPGQPLVTFTADELLAGGPAAVPALGEVFRGLDGHAYVTRSFDDDARTTDLLRVDGDTVTGVVSWTGAPRGLTAAPLRVDGGLAFLQDESVILLADPSARPVVHPLGAAVSDAQAAGGAIWFVEVDGGGAPSGVLRWTPDGVTRPLAAGVGQVVPVSADQALVTRLLPGGGTVTSRLFADGGIESVDLGGAATLGRGAWLR